MKRGHVIAFRVPSERRLKALFRKDPAPGTEFDVLGQKIARLVTIIANRSPQRAADALDRIVATLKQALDTPMTESEQR